VAVQVDRSEEVRARLLEMLQEAKDAQAHPADWLKHTKAVDAKSGEEFHFHFDEGWEWQREELSSYLEPGVIALRLKARQLGVSWLGIGYCVWKCLTAPGTRTLCVSTNETEAIKLVNRAWDLWENSPEHLRLDAKVIKPVKGRPSNRIEWEWGDGRVSSLLAMPSTPRAGHGETAGVVFLDEFSRHTWDEDSWKAFFPVIADGGQLLVVSTANGYGNVFYTLWSNAEERGIQARFLGADLHPGRDDAWFARARKVFSAPDMAEQYALNPTEAFLGTSGCWFDTESLGFYAENTRNPLYQLRFLPDEIGAKATMVKGQGGWVAVYDEPEETKEYAVYADIATGRGKDFTAAVVIDLTNMNIAATLHGKIDADLCAEQLHFLGRWYRTARIAVEMGGGYGEPVIIILRDGKRGRRPYPKLYRHVQDDRPDFKQNITFGFPITSKTRPLIINQLESAIRERTLPHIPEATLLECKTFVRQDTLPSPRAADTCNDDRVMSLAGALEMYRRYGFHEMDVRRARKREKKEWVPDYEWA